MAHPVRIDGVNLEKLKNYNKKWSLSYNDIIGMALEALDGAAAKKILIETPVYSIKVNLKKVKVNSTFTNLLNKGYDVFVAAVTLRQAIHIKRQLISKGYNVIYMKSECDGHGGFLFLSSEKKENGLTADCQESYSSPAPVS